MGHAYAFPLNQHLSKVLLVKARVFPLDQIDYPVAYLVT
jgi:hypothetical protein